jgi:NAD(P)-dependent dehydrogenase (short-subunit alcohol dehydrogenase family)
MRLRVRARLSGGFRRLADWTYPPSARVSVEPRYPPDGEGRLLGKRTALVTGAGTNIGRSIALEMARNGADILFTDIDDDRAKRLEQDLAEYPVDTRGFRSDVSDPEAVDALCETILSDYAVPDILVNNVGIALPTRTLLELRDAALEKVFRTNVFGPLRLTRRLSEAMIDQRMAASVLFLTSIHQWEIERDISYTASKAALGMIINELAVDLAPYGIRVNGIAPGFVRADEQGHGYKNPHAPLHQRSIPPIYIGRAAVYLAADYFSLHTTCSVLKIDAGTTVMNHFSRIYPPGPPRRGSRAS